MDHLIDDYPALHLIVNKKRFDEPLSLYALLQEHSKLDMTRSFNWQQTNSIGQYDNNDLETQSPANSYSSSLLSFENEELVRKYAYKQTFDYSYFVKQGRPFFAYHFFVKYQLEKFGKTNKTL